MVQWVGRGGPAGFAGAGSLLCRPRLLLLEAGPGSAKKSRSTKTHVQYQSTCTVVKFICSTNTPTMQYQKVSPAVP